MFGAKWLLLALVAIVMVTADSSEELDQLDEFEGFDEFNETDEFKIKPRIIQGKSAKRGQFPYYVFLEVHLPQGKARCGGSLISDQWVLTAGHCVHNAKSARVHLGALKAKDEKEPGRIIIDVDKKGIFPHPKYFQLFVLNDIGLIKLPIPVKTSDIIKPVNLRCSSSSGLDVTVIGNGKMHNKDKDIANILQYTQEKTVSILRCAVISPILIFRTTLLCVKGEEKRSVCNGDSGGPMIVTNDNKLIGVTSLGSAFGCEMGLPQGFTRVSTYLPWIKEMTGVVCKK